METCHRDQKSIHHTTGNKSLITKYSQASVTYSPHIPATLLHNYQTNQLFCAQFPILPTCTNTYLSITRIWITNAKRLSLSPKQSCLTERHMFNRYAACAAVHAPSHPTCAPGNDRLRNKPLFWHGVSNSGVREKQLVDYRSGYDLLMMWCPWSDGD